MPVRTKVCFRSKAETAQSLARLIARVVDPGATFVIHGDIAAGDIVDLIEASICAVPFQQISAVVDDVNGTVGFSESDLARNVATGDDLVRDMITHSLPSIKPAKSPLCVSGFMMPPERFPPLFS